MTVQQDLDSGAISRPEFLMSYKKMMWMVKEAAKCRQFDPPKKDDKLIGEFYKSFTLKIND